MEYIKLTCIESIYEAIFEFQENFPHLNEKVCSMKQFAQKLAEKAEVYIAREKNESVGITCFYANDNINYCGYITLIGIKTKYQKQGYGKELLSFTEKEMNKLKMKIIKLEVDKDNFNAQKFYIKNGFNKFEEKEKSFYMIKSI